MTEDVMDDKVCGKCLKRKLESEFAEGSDNCLKCEPTPVEPKKISKKAKLPDVLPVPTADNASGIKSQRQTDDAGTVVAQYCKRCNRWHPLDHFGLDPSDRSNDLIHRVCLDCISDFVKEKKAAAQNAKTARRDPAFRKKRMRTRRSKPKPKPRGSHWNRTYGITQDQCFWLLKKQKYKCAICTKHFPQRAWNTKQKQSDKPHLDHKHGSTIIRGFLCLKCNSGLGMFNDKPHLLREAANYLERTPPDIPANPKEFSS